MKRDRLYTVNKGNIFGLGDQMINSQLSRPTVVPYVDWSNPVQRAAATGSSAGLVNGFSSIADFVNPFSSGQTTAHSVGKLGAGTLGGGLLTAGAGLVGGIAKNAISGGLSSDVGNAVGSIGSTVGGVVSNFNPLIGSAITFASDLVGGTINRAFGSKMNEGNIAKVEEGIAGLRSAAGGLSQATDSNSLLAAAGNIDYGADFSNSFIGKDGWFSNKAKRKANELRKKQEAARAYAAHGLMTGAENVDSFLDDNVMGNFAAFGGLLPQGDAWGTVGGPAIDYGFMQDWLNNKKKKAEEKNGGTAFNLPASFAFGGDMQSNSADYSVGKVYDVSNEEANRLKAMGYEFTVVS